MAIIGPFDLKNAVLSSRHQNIPLHAAMGEIIDNSIEWKATEINIFLDWKTNPHHVYGEQPQKVVFIDNGVGMNKEKLHKSLVIGFHDVNISNENIISRFGVGCSYAFLTNCKKAEVYSKEEGSDWYYTNFDIDSPDFDSDDLNDLPPTKSKLKEPPEEYKEIWSSLKSGTITVWTKFDRGHVEKSKDEIPFWISRAFRKFIGEKVVNCKISEKKSLIEENNNRINIYYNKQLLKAYDPLYAIPYREKDEQGGKLYKPIVIRYPKSDASGMSELIVQIGLSPENWRQTYKISADSPVNIDERYIRGGGAYYQTITDSRKVSIIRNGREVSWLHDGYLFGRLNDLDRWFGVEILYNSELDDIFNIQNVKHQVGLSGELRTKIREEIKPTVQGIRNEINKVFETEKNKIQQIKKDEETDSRPTIEVESDDLDGAHDTDEEPNDFLKRQNLNAKERKKILDELSERDFESIEDYIKRVPMDTSLLFEYVSKGSEILMYKYMNHPWFKRMKEIEDDMTNYVETTDDISSDELEKYYHEIRILWEIMLTTFTISIATLSPTHVEQAMINKLLSKWGSLSMKYVEKRNLD